MLWMIKEASVIQSEQLCIHNAHVEEISDSVPIPRFSRVRLPKKH